MYYNNLINNKTCLEWPLSLASYTRTVLGSFCLYQILKLNRDQTYGKVPFWRKKIIPVNNRCLAREWRENERWAKDYIHFQYHQTKNVSLLTTRHVKLVTHWPTLITCFQKDAWASFGLIVFETWSSGISPRIRFVEIKITVFAYLMLTPAVGQHNSKNKPESGLLMWFTNSFIGCQSKFSVNHIFIPEF